MKIQRLNSIDSNFWSKLDKRLAWDSSSDKAIIETVDGILTEVKNNGDSAVIEYTNRFDRMSVSAMDELEIPAERLQQALDAISPVQREALEKAAARIKSYAQHQKMELLCY